MIKISKKNIFYKYLLPVLLIVFIFLIFLNLKDSIANDLKFSIKEDLRSRIEFTKETLAIWHEKSLLELEHLTLHLDELEEVRQELLRNESVFEIVLVDDVVSEFELNKYRPDGLGKEEPFFQGPILYKGKLVLFNAKQVQVKQKSKVVYIIYDFEKTFKIIKTAGRVGETGETYLVSQEGYMLSETRFYDQINKIPQKLEGNKTALNLKLIDPQTNKLTIMAQDLIEKRTFNCNIDGYPDYRGVPVVGCWIWLDKFGFGLATEIDESEAFSNYYEIVKKISVLFIGFLLFVYFYYIYLSSSSRLRKRLVDLNTHLNSKYDEINKLLKLINNHVIISKTDKNGIITFANEKFLNVSKYSLDEIKGRYHNIVN